MNRLNETVALDQILFPVEMIDNPNKTNPEYRKIVVGKINGEDYHLNYCSRVYGFVPNTEIFPKINDILDANNIQYSAEYEHTNYARFYADYTIDDPQYVYTMKGTTDEIKPMLKIRHSYNGLTKYQIVFGYYRMVCTNGLTIPVKEMEMFNLKIVGKHGYKAIVNSMEEFNEMLINFANNAPKIIDQITGRFEEMRKKEVANTNAARERIKEVLEASSIKIVENKSLNTIENILARIEFEANDPKLGYKGIINDWLIYNGINQYINDDERTVEAPESREKKDSEVLEFMLS